MAPTYSFKCSTCDLITEESYSMKDCPEQVLCPQCQGEARQFVNCENGFQLKGPGWASSRYTGKSNIRWQGDKPRE